MNLRNLLTKRRLKKENECLKHLVGHLELELKNVRTDLVIEQAALNGYRRENRELRTRIATLFDEHQSGFACVGVKKIENGK